MRTNTRPWIISALSFGSSLIPAVALADSKLEAGVTVGGHVFSSNSELGVSDRMNGASPESSVLLGGRVGYSFLRQLAGELEVVLVPTVDSDQSRGAAVFGVRGQVRYEPFGEQLMKGKLHPFVFAGYGFLAVRTDSNQLRNDADQAYHWGLGTHYALTANLDLRIDGKHLLVPDRSKNGVTSNFEMTAGVTWHFGQRQRGLATSGSVSSMSPVVEAPAGPGAVASSSTSAPAAVATQPPAAKPATASVAPKPAASPSAPTVVATAPTSTPPPVAAKLELPANVDQDRDGIPVPQDACPQEPEDRDGFRDDDGCPDLDNDGDGIVDSIDRCATDSETINGYADTDGCPDMQHPEMTAVPFARGSKGFTAESAASLDRSFQVLQTNPTFRVELSGHSSSDESNRSLSLRRAEAVKDYLVRRGISEARLKVLGYRSEQPVATGKSSAARAKNRRVELRLLPLETATK
jgi:outer membrane protein OmpA-like peptidoglycan-associated protein